MSTSAAGWTLGCFGGQVGAGGCVPLGKRGAGALCMRSRPPAQVVQLWVGFSRMTPASPSQAAYTCLFVFDCLRFSEFD